MISHFDFLAMISLFGLFLFFILSLEKSFETFPRLNGVARVFYFFALNLIIVGPLTNKQIFATINCKLKLNFVLCSVKLI